MTSTGVRTQPHFSGDIPGGISKLSVRKALQNQIFRFPVWWLHGNDLASDELELELAEICHQWHGQGIVREKGLLAAAAIA